MSFQDGDLVEFSGIPGTYWEVVRVLANGEILEIEYFAGPELTDHQHELFFGVPPSDDSVVHESIMQHANPLLAIATAAQ